MRGQHSSHVGNQETADRAAVHKLPRIHQDVYSLAQISVHVALTFNMQRSHNLFMSVYRFPLMI